ncbi:hypothetical protein E2C01_099493 [Portunus trituberculatus]|uniref:Uncharacterized protein n=1 Tax=Portunus trituberculatus TaxID=210409 RepID=A0A5B7KF45_PORTR|nr:hypothetical protein [Portunus trituberculatus]
MKDEYQWTHYICTSINSDEADTGTLLYSYVSQRKTAQRGILLQRDTNCKNERRRKRRRTRTQETTTLNFNKRRSGHVGRNTSSSSYSSSSSSSSVSSSSFSVSSSSSSSSCDATNILADTHTVLPEDRSELAP